MHHSIDYEKIQQLIIEDCMWGICRSCGEEQPHCEPEARNYLCENCGEREVFGAEENLFMLENYFD